MTEETRNEILQKMIFSAQNENKFTLMDLKDYLLGEHVDSDEDIAFFREELSKLGLIAEEIDSEDSDYIEEPSSDEIADLEEEGEEDDLLSDEDDMMGEDETDSIDLIDEPTDAELSKVEEEESEDEDEDEEDEENLDERDSYTKSFIRENFSDGSVAEGISNIDEDVEQVVRNRPNILGTDKGETSSDDPIRLYLRDRSPGYGTGGQNHP